MAILIICHIRISPIHSKIQTPGHPIFSKMGLSGMISRIPKPSHDRIDTRIMIFGVNPSCAIPIRIPVSTNLPSTIPVFLSRIIFRLRFKIEQEVFAVHLIYNRIEDFLICCRRQFVDEYFHRTIFCNRNNNTFFYPDNRLNHSSFYCVFCWEIKKYGYIP